MHYRPLAPRASVAYCCLLKPSNALPDPNVAASNQPRACNRLLVHQRSADGFAVHLPTVLQGQFQTPTRLSFGQLIDDLLQFSLIEAGVPLEEAFRYLEGIVDYERRAAVSLHADVALL